MTAMAAGVNPRERTLASLRQAVSVPGGWTALALTAVMVATVAWSIDDAAWVLGNAGYGDFLASASIIATLVGFAGEPHERRDDGRGGEKVAVAGVAENPRRVIDGPCDRRHH